MQKKNQPTFNVDMSLEQSLIVRIAKNEATSLEEAKELAKSQLESNSTLSINEKLKSLNNSLDVGEANVDIGLAEENDNHYKVAANYITTFNFDMKGLDSSIAERSEHIVKANARMTYQNMDVDVLASYAQHISASEVDACLLFEDEDALTA